MVSNNKIIANPKIFAAMVCRKGIRRRIPRRISRAHPRGKPKYERGQRRSFKPGVVGRLCETPPKSVAVESKACSPWQVLSENFRRFESGSQENRRSSRDAQSGIQETTKKRKHRSEFLVSWLPDSNLIPVFLRIIFPRQKAVAILPRVANRRAGSPYRAKLSDNSGHNRGAQSGRQVWYSTDTNCRRVAGQ